MYYFQVPLDPFFCFSCLTSIWSQCSLPIFVREYPLLFFYQWLLCTYYRYINLGPWNSHPGFLNNGRSWGNRLRLLKILSEEVHICLRTLLILEGNKLQGSQMSQCRINVIFRTPLSAVQPLEAISLKSLKKTSEFA